MLFGRHKWRERAFREVRDELDRFLNYPLNAKIDLGSYGIYDNRRCKFDWKGNVKSLGITITSSGKPTAITEDYATEGAVTVEESAQITGGPSIIFKFTRKAALVFRAHKMSLDAVELADLERSANKVIANGVAWSPDWVIITHIWLAEGFTQLVSGSSKAEIEIKATAPGAAAGFNPANPTLELKIASNKSMSYKVIGETAVRPYFDVHKLRQDMSGNWKLVRYGSNDYK